MCVDGSGNLCAPIKKVFPVARLGKQSPKSLANYCDEFRRSGIKAHLSC